MAAIMVASASGTKLAGASQWGSLAQNVDGGGKVKVQVGSLGGLVSGGGLRSSGGERTGMPRKRSLCIVAASPPKKDDGIRSGEPLTKQDLVGYLASGCKPKERWR